MKEISAIVAVAENGVIGRGLEIPWHISDEFKHFKATTMGGIIVFGRRTWESLGGKALNGRENVVISSNPFGIENVKTFPSIEKMREHYASDPRKIWICGGSKLYAAALQDCCEILLSRIKMSPEGDIFFPKIDDKFYLESIVLEHPQFTVERWVKK